MVQYVQKDALVGEINKRINDAPVNYIGHQRVWAYNDVKDILDTIEVKEVDLEKTINDYFKEWKFDEELNIMIKPNNYSATFDDIKEVAKHFIEIGMAIGNKI